MPPLTVDRTLEKELSVYLAELQKYEDSKLAIDTVSWFFEEFQEEEDTTPFKITSNIPQEVEGFEPPQEEVIPIRRFVPASLVLGHELDLQSVLVWILKGFINDGLQLQATTGECRMPMYQRRFHVCYQDNVECKSDERRFTNASDGKKEECNVYKKPGIMQEVGSITFLEFHESIPDASSATNVLAKDNRFIVFVLPVDYPALNFARAESASTDGHFLVGLQQGTMMSRHLTEKVAATVTSQCGCNVSVIAFRVLGHELHLQSNSRRNNIPSPGSAANWESNPNFPLMIELTPTDMNATNFPPILNGSRPFHTAEVGNLLQATAGECRKPMCQRRFHGCYQDNIECSTGERRFTNASDGNKEECNVYKKPDILQEAESITFPEFHEPIPDASFATNVPPN
ncbi:hypothetical protein Tco_0892988 [Tanacetum coccineum]|uniref:Uncharacterized protein n=1 Tax=Tanacetum coccineum TaxID=301880 RepID=A0ABQ5C7Q5_9ASTR